MKKRRRSLMGSGRSSYFRENSSQKRTPLLKRRPQKIRLRRRYAGSLLTRVARQLWFLTKLGLFGGALVGGTVLFMQFWENSEWVRVSQVELMPGLPPALKKELKIESGENLFTLKIKDQEKALLKKHPELKALTITRKLDRRVVIEGEYREAVAQLTVSGQQKGIDENGVLFPISTENEPQTPLPELFGSQSPEVLREAAAMLSTIKKELPEFYSLINRLKTDRILPVVVVLHNGVQITWGRLESADVVEKGKNVMRFLSHYEPKDPPGTLRFVTTNRLVMNANWKDATKGR